MCYYVNLPEEEFTMVEFSYSDKCLIVRVNDRVFGHISLAGFHTSREMLEEDGAGFLWVKTEDLMAIKEKTEEVMANGSI